MVNPLYTKPLIISTLIQVKPLAAWNSRSLGHPKPPPPAKKTVNVAAKENVVPSGPRAARNKAKKRIQELLEDGVSAS